MTDKPMTAAGHVHKYGYMPVWKDDGSAVESWWWCSSHDPGAWAKIEDDPEYASLFASDAFTEALKEGLRKSGYKLWDNDLFVVSDSDVAEVAAAMRGEQE